MLTSTSLCFRHQLTGASIGGMAIDDDDNIYLASWTSIQKVSLSGKIVKFSGSVEPGMMDGSADVARFYGLGGLAFDNDKNLLVCDSKNNRIRKVQTTGTVSTYINVGSPRDIVFDRIHNITYFSDGLNNINSISATGFVTTFVFGTACVSGICLYRAEATCLPNVLAVDSKGNVICNHKHGVFVMDATEKIEKRKKLNERHVPFKFDYKTDGICAAVDKDNIYLGNEDGHVSKLEKIDWCARLKVVPPLGTFPPGIIPLIASFLPTEYLTSYFWKFGGAVRSMCFNSRGMMIAALDSSVCIIHDAKTSFALGTDYFDDSEDTAPRGRTDEYAIIQKMARVRGFERNAISWFSGLDEKAVKVVAGACSKTSEIIKRDPSDVKGIKSGLFLSWASNRDLDDFDGIDIDEEIVEKCRDKGRRNLKRLRDNWLWSQYLRKHESITEHIGSIPLSDRDPVQQAEYSYSLSVLSTEGRRLELLKARTFVRKRKSPSDD